MRWVVIFVIASLLAGCHRVTAADVKAAKRWAAMLKPRVSPCGGRFLTDAELNQIIPGAVEVARFPSGMKYGYDGIMRSLSDDFKVKYVIAGSGVCRINFEGTMNGCSFYVAGRAGEIFLIDSLGSPPARPYEAPRSFCTPVKFQKDQ